MPQNSFEMTRMPPQSFEKSRMPLKSSIAVVYSQFTTYYAAWYLAGFLLCLAGNTLAGAASLVHFLPVATPLSSIVASKLCESSESPESVELACELASSASSELNELRKWEGVDIGLSDSVDLEPRFESNTQSLARSPRSFFLPGWLVQRLLLCPSPKQLLHFCCFLF